MTGIDDDGIGGLRDTYKSAFNVARFNDKEGHIAGLRAVRAQGGSDAE